MRAAPLLAGLAWAGAAAGCPAALDGFERLAGESAVVLFRPEPAPLAVGQGFSLELRACTPGGEPFPGEVEVDAVMPAHGHGMNYRPVVERQGPGRYRARGLLLHMPGRWELRFTVHGAGGAERLVADRVLR